MNGEDAARPAFVLLHGAGLGAWIWDEVVPRLAGPSLAVDMPALRGGKDPVLRGASLDDVVGNVVDEAEGWGQDRVTLVGHSLAGAVALAVTARIPDRIAQLVFVSAVVPRDGGTCMPLLPPGMRTFLSVALRWAPWLTAPGDARGPWSAMGQRGVRSALCNDFEDLDAPTAKRVARGFAAAAPRLYYDPVSWSGVPSDLPRSYLKLTADRSGMSAARQDQMIANLGGADVRSLHAGHLPMLSRPPELVAILNESATR